MGEVAHRLHCLQHLKLKTVIKVSASSITSVTVVGDAMLTAYLVISLKCCDRPYGPRPMRCCCGGICSHLVMLLHARSPWANDGMHVCASMPKEVFTQTYAQD